MNQGSTVASVSPSVSYFLMYALYRRIFNVIMWLFMAVSTASTQFLGIQYVSVAFHCLMQGRRTCPRRPGRGPLYYN